MVSELIYDHKFISLGGIQTTKIRRTILMPSQLSCPDWMKLPILWKTRTPQLH